MKCCSAIDKLDKLPWEDVEKELIEKGVKAESTLILRELLIPEKVADD
jgi:hypothetical protein